MPTGQDSPRSGRRAAHFSNSSEGTKAVSPASSTKRTATPRSATERTTARAANRTANGSNHMSERTARATQRAAAARQRRSQKNAKGNANKRPFPFAAVLALVAVLAVVGIGFLVVPHLFQNNAPKQEEYPAGEEVIVTIPDGAGGAQIAQILIENHVLSDESSFYQEAQKQNADANMKSGTYQFVTGATASEVVRQLVVGPNATQYQLKLAEGLTVTKTAAAVEEQLGVSGDEFIEQAKASNYENDYAFLQGVSDDSLEGYLFAKTYDFGGKDINADTVIRTMLDQYQTEVDSLDMDAARDTLRERFNIDITDYGILKVASIIEKEAVTEEDRPLVASVIYNRLSLGMYIQSDATMMYVTGGEVTADDLQTDSPYNTYKNAGLTPTPICSPSLASIQAALDPAETKYLYFFINDKVHTFSETYEEHQQAINESLYG
ncbi:MAG: endolytic transglycosylase MltG [Atopobiaceae bacterium]|nr:endolytic transglycosylase MltG [Atopobiaceae bacterium]